MTNYINGYDFDGTADNMPVMPNSVIITGRNKKDEKILRKIVGNDIPIFFFGGGDDPEGKAKFKGEKIKELGLKTYFENEIEQVNIIREIVPDVNVVHVKEDGMKFVTFSQGWDGMPIAFNLQQNGENSIVGQIQDKSELKLEGDKDKEDPEDKEKRLSQYDNMIKKYPSRKLIDALKKVKDKDNYFIFFDQNNLYELAQELLDAGFTNGLFPTKEDFDFEKGREAAMEFVEENYPDIKIIPHQKIATVEEAKAIVEESEVPLVIQSEGDFVSTICPVDDVEQNKTEILSALDKYAKDYAKGEILLKEKLVQPIEITPQIVFWNGEPVFTDLDIETKNIGDGENNGNQVGCGSNLIIKTDLEDKINKIAFPPIVFEMAKKHTGIFVWDISIYITEKGLFFGEFCSNRFGYDALMTEMTMSGGASKYFTSIMNVENPLQDTFGAAVRVFNLSKQDESQVTVGDYYKTWLYEAKMDKDIVSTSCCWDLGVITGSGDTSNEAINETFDNLNTLSFKEKYTRTKVDFLKDYPTSIVNRFKGTNKEYYYVTEIDEEDSVESSKLIAKFNDRFDGAISNIKSELDELKMVKSGVEKSKSSIRNKLKLLLNTK